MNTSRPDRALLLLILAVVGGLHWQVFSMTERLSAEIAEISERVARVATDLEYIAPGSAGPASEQAPSD